MPHMLLFGHDQRPVQQIADMSQNLARCPSIGADAKIRKGWRNFAKRFSAAIRKRGEGMTKEIFC